MFPFTRLDTRLLPINNKLIKEITKLLDPYATVYIFDHFLIPIPLHIGFLFCIYTVLNAILKSHLCCLNIPLLCSVENQKNSLHSGVIFSYFTRKRLNANTLHLYGKSIHRNMAFTIYFSSVSPTPKFFRKK